MSLADLDHDALIYARTRLHGPGPERLVSRYSRLGEHGACWIVLGLCGASVSRRRAERRAWLRGVRIVVGAYALNQAIKFSVRRRRPQLSALPPLTPTVSQLSLPSAHATTSFAAARAYSAVAPAGPLYAAALAFAYSRPYLGVHYPTDVFAGAALGTAVAEAWPR